MYFHVIRLMFPHSWLGGGKKRAQNSFGESGLEDKSAKCIKNNSCSGLEKVTAQVLKESTNWYPTSYSVISDCPKTNMALFLCPTHNYFGFSLEAASICC